jgi:kynureninase
MTITLADCRRMDASDPLRAFKDRFDLPAGVIYLDGNSLGALPRATSARMAQAITQEWGQGLVRSWNAADWISAPQRVGSKIARIVGARPNEVIVADSTSVNVFKLLVAALKARPGRKVILTESGNFPTDLYMAQGVAALFPDVELRAAPRGQLLCAMTDDVAVVMLTHVHYKTGETFDMAAMTAAAQACGALMLWDLCHSVGAVPVDLNAVGADLAIGCGYKYLNGGPGAPAFLYAAERHHAHLVSPLTGWMGHAAPFQFDDAYEPGEGVNRFLCGTPGILAMSALEVGVDLMLEVDRAALFAKSQQLCALMIDLVTQRCDGLGLELVTPADPGLRGSHVSYAHPEGYAIVQALMAEGVIGDFRAPDILRLGFAPLYVSFEDVWRSVDVLEKILREGLWNQDVFKIRAAVT